MIFSNKFYYQLLLIIFFYGNIVSAQDSTNLSLENAVGLALQYNHDIKISALEHQIAEAANHPGATGALPNVQAVIGNSSSMAVLDQKLANGTEQTRFPVWGNNLNASVALSWQVFDGWRMYAIRDRLNASEEMARLAYENTLRTTVFEVCMAYFGLARLQARQQALQGAITFFEEREKLAKARFETGATAKGEWLQAQTDLNEQRAALLQLKSAMAEAAAALELLIGPRATAYRLTDGVPRPPAYQLPVSALIDSAHANNPQWLSLQQSLALALAQRKEAASRMLPQLAVNSAFTALSTRSTAGFMLLNQNAGLSAGFTLSMPIFDGRNTAHQVRAAESAIAMRQEQQAQMEESLSISFQKLMKELNFSLDQTEIERETIELARENVTIAQERYRRAQATALELRQAQLTFLDAQARLVDARYAASVADLQIRLLAGLPIRG